MFTVLEASGHLAYDALCFVFVLFFLVGPPLLGGPRRMFRRGPNPLSVDLVTTLEVSSSPTLYPTAVIHLVSPKLGPLVADV